MSRFHVMQRESTQIETAPRPELGHAAGVPQSYSTAQVAALMGVTRQTINAWISAGLLPAFNIGNDDRPRLRVTAPDLHAFIEARRLGGVA